MSLSTRERILDHARDLFLAGGMSGFSMRKLADRVGVTATALYRHYEGKEALLVAVIDAGYARFASYLMRGLDGATAADRLDRSGEGYARFAVEHPAYYRMMFMSSRDDFGYDAIPRQNADKQQRSFRMLIDRVRECQDEQVLRAQDPAELALLIWSFSHGLASLYVSGHLRMLGDAEAFVRYFRQARHQLIDGLAPGGDRDRVNGVNNLRDME
jgi:AcrR family transcriptional regulator